MLLDHIQFFCSLHHQKSQLKVYGNKQFTRQAVLWNKNLHVAIETWCFDRFYPWGLFRNCSFNFSFIGTQKFSKKHKDFQDLPHAYIMFQSRHNAKSSTDYNWLEDKWNLPTEWEEETGNVIVYPWVLLPQGLFKNWEPLGELQRHAKPRRCSYHVGPLPTCPCQ